MPNQPERIDDLLDLLYLAAAEPSAWPDCLASLAGLFDARAAVLIAQWSNESQFSVGASIGVSQEMIRRYDEYYVAVDPWRCAVQAKGINQWVARGTDMCSVEQFERSEFYNDLWKESSCFYQAGMFRSDPDQAAIVSMHRTRARKDFDDEDLRLLQRLFPHLRRALAVHRKIIDLNNSLARVAGAVDALDVALIGLGPQRGIRLMNAPAEALLRAGDLIVERNGCLFVNDSQAQVSLDRLLSAAATRSLTTLAGGSLSISNARRTLLLTVLPANSYAAIGGDPMTALLLLVDPHAQPKSRSLLLSQLFGLTPAENRVVMLLLEGLDPNAIAARTHTTPGTVRFQLKSVYRKLGVTRQSQLVRLVSRIPGISDAES